MKTRAAFLAVLLLCTCNDRDVGLSLCKGETNLQDSCRVMDDCSGQCVAAPPLEWSMPALLWVGPQLMAPECPADWASTPGYEGHANLLSPECGSCACDPPQGECGLPTSLFVSTAPCHADGGTAFSFAGLDADPDVCNSENGVSLALGAQSITVGPLTVIETGCMPVEIPPASKAGSVAWSTFARACVGIAPGRCLDPGSSCVPAADLSPGFSRCIYRAGDLDCPSAYPTKHVFYDNASDSRGCSACSCGAPMGSVCSAHVSTYQDALCSDPSIVFFKKSFGPVCRPIPLGHALMGKRVQDITYEPGGCEPLGGEPVGSVELLGPTTFCCQE